MEDRAIDLKSHSELRWCLFCISLLYFCFVIFASGFVSISITMFVNFSSIRRGSVDRLKLLLLCFWLCSCA